MKQLFALLVALVVSTVGAQTVQTTPNLIKSGTTHTWYGVTTGALPAGYMPGGPTPIYDPSTNTISFSYNASASVGQTFAVNQALASVGAGVKINGYTYSYDVRNMNGDDRQGSIDTFTVSQLLRGPSNSVLLSSSQYHNTKFDWKTVTGSRTATTPYNMVDTSYIQFGVSGGDNGYWGGYFGPQIRNVDMRLNYTIDPCVANPLSDPSCANYNQVVTSQNIAATSYAINQALNLSGAGVQINGFQYGYHYYVGDGWCRTSFLGVCLNYDPSSMDVNVNVTSSTGSTLYSATHSHTNQNTGGNLSYSYVFPSQRLLSSMGNFSLTTTEIGTTALYSSYSNWQYTPDPCTINPLSSTSCAGYQQAYQDQQCAANPLYATTCPGYQQAYFTQQCTANSLYNSGCPGYATAYYNYQCSINPLGDSTCPGYASAYHDQQCSISPLFMSDCPGYQQAYFNQQCSISSLYSNQCPGYAAAYKSQQCGLNALYATDCPGYAQAYFTQQCNISGLYDRSCPNYGSAYATKNILSTSTSTTTTASTTPTVTVVTSTDTTTVSNPAAIAISDPVVSNSVSTPNTTSATSPTSVTSVITTTSPMSTASNPVAAATASATAPVTVAPAQAAATAAENKKTDGAVSSVEKKSGGNQAAAKAAATERAKELANDASKAATLEQQAATQGLVVGLMGYVPGFSAYQNSMVPDVNVAKMARQYNKPVVDNRSAQRLLSGANEAKWQEMVDSQYKQGK